jgi:nicotinamide-nucleotide amidase
LVGPEAHPLNDQSDLERLAAGVLACAIERGLSIVTAESCTAGELAHLLAQGEGASQHFHGGIVTYTKAMKTDALGVSARLLAEKTAVCAEVAAAMAEGALQRSPADVALSITGVAGPEPDEDGNPVGLIHCAVARRGRPTLHELLRSQGDGPDEILADAMRHALRLLKRACLAD